MRHLLFSFLVVGAISAASPCLAQLAPPEPPAGAVANQMVPPHDAEGIYQTPNRRLIPEAIAWHVRAALNVAALGCRDAAEAQTIALYNVMLRQQRDVLARADTAVRADFRARFGAGWQNRHDDTMTRVYNFFAQPPAQATFCEVARGVLAEAATVEPGAFLAFAADALPRLEAPFTDFYRAYDAWRVALAEWQGRSVTASAVEVAAATLPSIPASFEP